MKFLTAESKRALKTPKGLFCSVLIVVSFAISLVTFLTLLGQIGQPFAGFRYEPTLTISAINEDYWPGPQKGMNTYDKILKVNGKPIYTPHELQELVRQTPIGQSITYTLIPKDIPEGKTVTPKEISVPVQAFTLQDFSRSCLTIFIVGLLHLLVGAVAYIRQPDNPAARAHLFVTFSIGMVSMLTGDYDLVMIFPRLWIAAVALTGATCLHLGLYFPQKKKIVTRLPWLVYVPYAISFSLLGAWQYAFRHLGYEGYKQAGVPDLFDLHFALNDASLGWSLGIGFLGLFVLIIHSFIKSESLLVRNQAKVALFGALLAYLPMTIFWLILDQILEFNLPASVATLCWVMFLVFPLSVAYAIVKHKMFDIEFVLKQSMTYTALVALLGGGYVLVATGLQQVTRSLMASNSELTSYMITTAMAVVIFEPLKLTIRDFIDQKFFRTKYDFRTALSDFTDTARSTINMDELIPKLVDIMEKTIHPKHILLFLKDKENNALKQAYNYGIDFKLKDAIPLDDAALLGALGLNRPNKKQRTGRFTSTLSLGAELRADAPIPSPLPFLLAKRITAQLPKLEEMDAINNSLTLPLTVKTPLDTGGFKDELIGLLTLGEKRSELEYTIEDRQLFQSIGQQLALTLHGSHLAEDAAEKEAIKQTLLKARMIQKSMLPQEEMQLDKFDVTGFSESADETGGDYYDWYNLGEGQFIVGVGDVTGHGIDAAMIVSMAKSCLYNQVVSSPEVPDVMAALNRTLNDMAQKAQRQHRKLMSFIYSYFDTETLTCKMASAGHWFPYHYSASTGTLTNFPDFQGTFPLGQRPAEKFKCTEHQITVEPNDILIYFTDGLHEAQNTQGQDYDFERLEQLIHWYKDLSAHEIKARIQADWEDHIKGHGMDDDMTLVVIKVRP